MLIWVPAGWVADEATGLPGTRVEAVDTRVAVGGDPPPTAVAEVEFHAPPLPAFLARLRDGALLVNAARGPAVDTAALVAEVSRGRLQAAMDVTDPEPLPEGHPLCTLPGAFITPHTGASTPVSLRRAARLARDQAAAHVKGEPLRNVITGAY